MEGGSEETWLLKYLCREGGDVEREEKEEEEMDGHVGKAPPACAGRQVGRLVDADERQQTNRMIDNRKARHGTE